MTVDVDEDILRSVVRAATGCPEAELATWAVAACGHRIENMTTDSLDRVSGTLVDGTPWSVFVKVLHPASASPVWHLIPEEHHAAVLAELDWLDEPRLYRCGLAEDLPRGLRLPQLFRVDEAPERITLWLEDVADDPCWDLDRYHRSAVALGRLAGHWPEERAVGELGIARRPLDQLFFGKISHLDLPAQADDRFWSEPSIATVVDDRHRDDLERLRDAVPHLLGRLEAMRHGMAHGDATPDNLREPGDGTIVAIDWSYGHSGPLGSDLGQLLAGRTEAGAIDPCQLADVARVILDGYVDGLAQEGCAADPAAVEEAWATHLAVRSVFSALLLDHRPDLCGREREELLARRAALARFGLDLALRTLERV